MSLLYTFIIYIFLLLYNILNLKYTALFFSNKPYSYFGDIYNFIFVIFFIMMNVHTFIDLFSSPFCFCLFYLFGHFK